MSESKCGWSNERPAVQLKMLASDLRAKEGRAMTGSQTCGDAGVSAVVAGVVLVLIVATIAATALVPLRAWCPTGCGSTLPPAPAGARWAACEPSRDAAWPACSVDEGEGLVMDANGQPSCAWSTRSTMGTDGELPTTRGLACIVTSTSATIGAGGL